MKVIFTFLSLIFAIYAAVMGIEFIKRGSNEFIFFGICCLVLAVGLSYLSVSSLLRKKRL